MPTYNVIRETLNRRTKRMNAETVGEITADDFETARRLAAERWLGHGDLFVCEISGQHFRARPSTTPQG